MVRAFQAIRDYWWIPVFAIGSILLWAIFNRKPGTTPLSQTKAELEAIDAKREARSVRLELGAEAAKKHVRDKYQAALEELTVKQAEQAKGLEDDPERLAQLLERATRK